MNNTNLLRYMCILFLTQLLFSCSDATNTNPENNSEESEKDGEQLSNEALTELKEGNLDSALSLINQAIELEAMNTYYVMYKGDIYFNMKEYDSSVTYYTKAINLDSLNLLAYMGRASAQWDIGNLDEAILDYQTVLTIDSSFDAAKRSIETIRQIQTVNGQ